MRTDQQGLIRAILEGIGWLRMPAAEEYYGDDIQHLIQTFQGWAALGEGFPG
jgi:hypothetical protein